MLAQVTMFEIIAVLVYFSITAYLGWLGWRRTRTAADYLLAGRKTHPFIMALSYGSTFISTSAIVGFGGMAGQLGMSLLWLVFLNIFVGIFIAFVFLGSPTRKMGHALDAHTFPELLGRRFQSKGIQVFVGWVIFLFMPLYAAAVIIGGCKFFGAVFGIDYNMALLIFAVLVAVYVFYGGMKGVMYTDAFQGTVMIAGMLILLIATYWIVGGVTESHKTLAELKPLSGHMGWTGMPEFGWGQEGVDPVSGKSKYSLWWVVVSTITLGVGIGVLAQPQLVVRFMTVKSRRELNRAVMVGGVFILLMTGTTFVVGSVSNAYFAKEGPLLTGTISGPLKADKNGAMFRNKGFAMMKVTAVADNKIGADLKIVGQVVPVVLEPSSPRQAGAAAQGRTTAMNYGYRAGPGGKAVADVEQIIPRYITQAMPKWFGVLFLLTLLAAAMSTLSGQFHALGAAIGRDVYEQMTASDPRNRARGMHVVRMGMLVGIVLASFIAYIANSVGIEALIMRGTAIFFGLCTSSFLAAFLGCLFWKRMTKVGALASMIVGFVVTAFWLIFVNGKTAADIGILAWLQGKTLAPGGQISLLMNHPNWPDVDPMLVAFPLSILTAIVVSLVSKPPAAEHLARCFGESQANAKPAAPAAVEA